MKDITYKKRDLAKRGRAISTCEGFDDAESTTLVRKNYIYLISPADAIPQKPETPQIRLTKCINTSTKTETFVLKVKGCIYVTEKRFIYRVKYCHSLFINMVWKTHVLSSKPAAFA